MFLKFRIFLYKDKKQTLKAFRSLLPGLIKKKKKTSWSKQKTEGQLKNTLK